LGLTGDGPPIHLLIQITPVGRGASSAAAQGVEKVAAKLMKSLLPQPRGFVQSPDTEESLALTKRRM
jgi:hypothetical protein